MTPFIALLLFGWAAHAEPTLGDEPAPLAEVLSAEPALGEAPATHAAAPAADPLAHPAAHGDAAHGDAAHGDAAHGDAAHGDAAHGGHHDPWADEDHDGTPSWLDPTLGDEPNEAYALNGLKWHLINLLLLLGVLGYFAKKPLMSFLAGRAAEIREEVQDAAALKAEADARHQALIARMEAFDGEVRAIEEDAVRRAAEEEAKLKERSEHAAAQILDNATRQIREETSRAQAALRTEAVELAVQLAERTLRETVQADDQRRLAAQFLETLRAAEVKHG